jgi:hypothetical protein
MRLTTLLLMLLIFRSITATANDKGIPVAVFDFKTNEKEIRVQGPKLTAVLTAALSADPRMVLVERAQLNKALNEQALGLSGNVSAEAAAQIGHLTGAKVLVSGYLYRYHQETGNKDQRVIAIAYIVGTETGRLYTERIDAHFPTDFPDLADKLAAKIVTNIVHNISNLAITLESHEERLQTIINTPKGDKRPVVLVNLTDHSSTGATNTDTAASLELAIVLHKAGFKIVDESSDQKPDVVVTGVTDCDCGSRGGQLVSCRSTIVVKVQERATGRIISFDRGEESAIDLGAQTANKLAREKAADEIARRLIPVLAE